MSQQNSQYAQLSQRASQKHQTIFQKMTYSQQRYRNNFNTLQNIHNNETKNIFEKLLIKCQVMNLRKNSLIKQSIVINEISQVLSEKYQQVSKILPNMSQTQNSMEIQNQEDKY